MKPRVRLPFWVLTVVAGFFGLGVLCSAVALAVVSSQPLMGYAHDGLLLSAFLLFWTIALGAAQVDREVRS